MAHDSQAIPRCPPGIKPSTLDVLLILNNSIPPQSHKTPASWPSASPTASHQAHTWKWPNLHEISPRYPSPSIGAITKVALERRPESQWRGRWLEAFHLDPVSIRSEVVVRGRRDSNEICRCSIAAAAVVTRRSRKTRRTRYEHPHKLIHNSDRSVRPCLPKRPRAARIAENQESSIGQSVQ